MRILLLALLIGLPAFSQSREWPVYGGNAESTRYSPLKQINRSNVSRLQVAWTYDLSDGRTGLQTNPIVVEGLLYGNTAAGKIIALDAATGQLKWSWDSKSNNRGARGVTYWAEGGDKRIFAGFGRYIYALEAKTGAVITGFGKDGRIDLHQDLGRDPERMSVSVAAPPILYKDLLIVGGRESEGLPASPGDIRAYNVKTGQLRWSFHTIPHPGEFGYETWPKDAWTYNGAANNWAGMAVDAKRGIVYAPTGSAAADFYGANRVGDNLFANTLIALNAATGERIWHFQAVKHDIWDRDFPSPPTLVTVKHQGKIVDAVAQTSKQGWLFLFDRASGKPLFPIEYRGYPPSAIEGEVAAATQPLPTKPAPFSRQTLTEDMLTNRTPESRQWALEQFRNLRSEGQFIPFGIGKETVIFPGFDGGAEWGGSAFDPTSGLLYVNANDVAWTSSLAPNPPATSGRQTYLSQCASCHGEDLKGNSGQFPSLVDVRTRRTADQVTAIVRNGSNRMPGFASLSNQAARAVVQYVMTGEAREAEAPPSPTDLKFRFTGYHKWLDPDGYPAVAPPWGTLNAINLNTGEYAWRIPLGEYPELVEKGMKNTGSENYGGPVVTAGGLVFIGATNFDKKFRAFDKTTGKLLWETTMVNSGNGTPATYEMNGRQFVVIAATGNYVRTGQRSAAAPSAYVAFALPTGGLRKK